MVEITISSENGFQIMKSPFPYTVLAIILFTVANISLAADSDDELARANIIEGIPEVGPGNIQPSVIPGLYEVRIGAQVAYVSADGRYVLQGDLIDLTTDENLTESRRSAARIAALDQVGESNMIIFRPEEAQHTITVFTDIDCGYCRKLHSQIDDYTAHGIKVRYMFYPRSGPDTESWFKAETVWCSADRNTALTQAKAGATIPEAECEDAPVAEHYSMGQDFGIRGTPAILLDTGELVPGYVPPDELAEILAEG